MSSPMISPQALQLETAMKDVTLALLGSTAAGELVCVAADFLDDWIVAFFCWAFFAGILALTMLIGIQARQCR